jgi:dTMP kinase
VVISDRFADSTRVYQGVARGDLRGLVDDLHARVIGIEPDLTFILDTDPTAALSRGLARNSGEDRFEDMGEAFQHRLRDGFRALASQFPGRCRLIDGNRPEAEIAAEVLALARP